MTKTGEPYVAKAYAVVPTDDSTLELTEDVSTVSTTPSAYAKAVDLHQPCLRTVGPAYQHLPEARGLTWEDDFFDDEVDEEEDIVAVFDMDYDLMEEYYGKVGIGALCALLFFPQVLGLALLCLAPCYLKPNIRWCVRAQHVAVTRDGIRFVRDKRQTCWGQPCSDAGKCSKTVPFDKITDCDIVEPAGKTCLVIPNTLHTVHVDTASSEKSQHELSISGLKDPVAFKKLVWAMKRAYHPAAARFPSAMEMLGRNGDDGEGKTDDKGEDVTNLLREIRDELRQNNEVLNSLKQPPPSAPQEPKGDTH